MGAKLTKGDVTNLESIREGMTGAEAVIHNAGWYEMGIRRKCREEMRAVNVLGTENTLGLAVELGIPKIVHVSTILAFGDTGGIMADETFQRCRPPLSWYEKTKTEGHEAAVKFQQQGAPVVIACPGGVIGPGDHSGLGHLARMYVRGWLPPILFAAKGSRSAVHVDDVAEGIVRCLEQGRPGESYILGGGVINYREMFNFWKTTPGGLKTTLFWMPDPMAYVFNLVCEPFQRPLGMPVLFCREFARSGFASFNYSSAKAERELGMRFRSVEQAFLDTLEAERSLAKAGG